MPWYFNDHMTIFALGAWKRDWVASHQSIEKYFKPYKIRNVKTFFKQFWLIQHFAFVVVNNE